MPRAKNQNPAFNWELGIGTASVTKSCHRLLWDGQHNTGNQNTSPCAIYAWCKMHLGSCVHQCDVRTLVPNKANTLNAERNAFSHFFQTKLQTTKPKFVPQSPSERTSTPLGSNMFSSNWKLLVILKLPKAFPTTKATGFQSSFSCVTLNITFPSSWSCWTSWIRRLEIKRSM